MKILGGTYVLDPLIHRGNPTAMRRGLQMMLDRITDEQLLQADRVEIVGVLHEQDTTGIYDYIDDVDDAIITILGYDPWRQQREAGEEVGFMRPRELERAMAKAYRDRRPMDQHDYILLAAYRHLEEGGAFRPRLGWDRPAPEPIPITRRERAAMVRDAKAGLRDDIEWGQVEGERILYLDGKPTKVID
ncbi:hypothetical protein vBCbaSRXM_97 [Citromicrobium phage vB_CbaS-RXM]|nr:hypothetical protein vBCbaSRXM_97 [Citromicrobium phage vB_CbaS-RXM]